MRKILHIDMDAFYASVEQRDDPALRGRPVVVAWRGARSVVCAASYEARRFGIRSAMPALRAERLCPDAVFVPPDFSRYRAVSRQIREIFLAHTPLVEPLSLDEAYLDVSENLHALPSATAVAQRIRAQIRECTQLTASAGVAANKFLAKIASDWRKPDGLFVIKPHQVERFLGDLPVTRIPGVGKVTQGRLAALGAQTVGQLRALAPSLLHEHFASYGQRLYELARGIDERSVCPNRPTQSISAEDTLAEDQPLAALRPLLDTLAARVWSAASKESRVARTVVLKLKTHDFRVLTRSHTPDTPPKTQAHFLAIAHALCARVGMPESERYRLLGVGLANFVAVDVAPDQADLFS